MDEVQRLPNIFGSTGKSYTSKPKMMGWEATVDEQNHT